MRIEIYTKPNCPYCVKAKNLFSQKGLPYEEKNITDDAGFRAELLERVPHAKTVPQIFFDGRAMGGYDDIKNLDLK